MTPSKTILYEDKDIQDFFDRMNEQAPQVNENLLSDVASFNNNSSSLEILDTFNLALQETPYSTTSSSVIS